MRKKVKRVVEREGREREWRVRRGGKEWERRGGGGRERKVNEEQDTMLNSLVVLSLIDTNILVVLTELTISLS